MKKDMTKLRIGDKFVPVTLLQFVPQTFVALKTIEKDGYMAAILGYNLKTYQQEKWIQSEYQVLTEIRLDTLTSIFSDMEIGNTFGVEIMINFSEFALTATSKGKWYQWGVKRFHIKGMDATHGHKFTRHLGSKGNRKPRRTMKWHPHAGHMGLETVTIRHIQIVDRFEIEWEQLIAVKWSIPGRRNSILKAYF